MDADATVVIVGAGQGGFQAASSLRDEGFAGRITVLGDEPGLPYQRPPLSKAFLLGKADEGAIRLRNPDFFRGKGITVLDDVRAEGIDRDAARLRVSTGEALAYDALVLATGARNRPLPVPGAELEGVHQLRTLAEASAIKARLGGVREAVVVGAGFIGLEFAAVAASLGIAVTVLEATARPMSRALSLPMSGFFADAHRRAGIRLEFGAVVVRIDGRDGRAVAVETADDRVFPADLVLVGIGVIPNAELAAEAGLAVANGVVVDEELRTADPAISAIGDCAAYPSPFATGGPARLESVQNAVDHARCVAARLVGRSAPYRAVPWFWSDQGPLKLQIAGLAIPHERTALRGDPASGAFSVFCYEGERLLGVESVNKPGDHVLARRLLSAGLTIGPDEVSDPGLDLKARANALLAG